jgi:hypothetical protein
LDRRPILTIDASGVRNAGRHTAWPYNGAGAQD